ncbi:hypothetical protein JW898_02545 [Candidatus Woesearchaeota archaeon]|nr:hypothetical protein [Candidatus Woesearchaeota archaeon]
MEWVKYSNKYFHQTTYDDSKSGIRVEVAEGGNINIIEEGFSLRVKTRSERDVPKHRNYAIEHHPDQPHDFPHIQFKFITEEIGTIRIRIDLADSEEYDRAVKGFIYKIKTALDELEEHKEGITGEILVLDLVNQLSSESKFLSCKMAEGIAKYSLDFEDKKLRQEGINNLKSNHLLLEFMGRPVINSIETAFKNHQKEKEQK